MVKQPLKGAKPKKKVLSRKPKVSVVHKYGTSRLERDFARDFLDKYSIKYVYQFKAVDIGRYFDFAVVENQNSVYLTEEKDGLTSVKQEGQRFNVDFLIEVDGGYFHGDPRVVGEGKKLNRMQQRSKMVDGIKDRWASLNCIPLLRVWEYDIRYNPRKVAEELGSYIKIANHREKVKTQHKAPHPRK
ncbi:MAG: hypothetical protein LUD72_04405 [Bacteroidales bacterium]|nr:hypothetical protein [Bacteroidales bacterium]